MSDTDFSVMEFDSSGSDTELDAFIDYSDVAISSRASSTVEETSDDSLPSSQERFIGMVTDNSSSSLNVSIGTQDDTVSISSGIPNSTSSGSDSDSEVMIEDDRRENDVIFVPQNRIISQSNNSASPPAPRSTVYAPVPSPNYLPASPMAANIEIHSVPTNNNEIVNLNNSSLPINPTVALGAVQESINAPGTSAEPQYPSTSKSKSSKMKQTQHFNTSTSEEDGLICPICFEQWTNSGLHRLVSLKCGHLFGQECIEKWIKSTTSKSKCPQCNASAKKSDIRRIYARFLKVLDTSEKEQAVKELENEKQLRKKLEMEKIKTELKLELASKECEKLKKDLIDHKSLVESLRRMNNKGMRTQSFQQSPVKRDKFILKKVIELNKEGGCRVMAVSDRLPLLVTTQPSKNALFTGYGIKKFSMSDLRSDHFMPLHQKDIKDVVFHPHDSLILTASLDKTVKLTNVNNNTVVHTYNMPTEAWSCAWNKDDTNTFFVGLRNGCIRLIDTRKPNEEVFELPACIPMSPVVGMHYIQRNNKSPISMSGVLALQLSGCSFYEKRTVQEYKPHLLPIEGRFTSVSIESTTNHTLISARPSPRQPNVRHLFCELTFSSTGVDNLPIVNNKCSLNIHQTLDGGETQSQITKSNLFLSPENETTALACAGDETTQAALIWDVNTGKCIEKLKADCSILDVCDYRVNHDFYLATLTKTSLRIYKWNDQ